MAFLGYVAAPRAAEVETVIHTIDKNVGTGSKKGSKEAQNGRFHEASEHVLEERWRSCQTSCQKRSTNKRERLRTSGRKEQEDGEDLQRSTERHACNEL
jgi:hypothetical protein